MSRKVRIGVVLTVVLALLFGVPWWTLLFAGSHWPVAVEVIGTVLIAAMLIALPVAMGRGHGKQLDGAARIGDTLLGLVWIAFVWSVLSLLLRAVLAVAGVESRSRIIAVAVLIVIVVVALWGHYEAMRVPRIKRREVFIDRLGRGLDGLRIVLLTDTHYGPINREAWSRKTIDEVNRLEADVVCHVGDIADGSVDKRRAQAAPLEDVVATLAKAYVTGNHEYFGEAQT